MDTLINKDDKDADDRFDYQFNHQIISITNTYLIMGTLQVSIMRVIILLS